MVWRVNVTMGQFLATLTFPPQPSFIIARHTQPFEHANNGACPCHSLADGPPKCFPKRISRV